MREEGAYRSRLDFQAISHEHTYPSLSQQSTPQRIQHVLGQLLEQECGPLLQESVLVSNTPLRQRSPGMVRYICVLLQTLTTSRPAPWYLRERQLSAQRSYTSHIL